MDIPGWLALVVTGGGAFTGLVTGVATARVAHARTKIDFNQSLTDAFKVLTDQLQEEREDLIERLEKQDLKIEQQRSRIQHLESHITILEWHAHTLEKIMLDAGMQVPILNLERGLGG